MKNPLGKTEIIGLLFLLLLVTGITAIAVLMRGCNGEIDESKGDRKIEIEVLGEDNTEKTDSEGKVKQKNKTSSKKGGVKKKTSKKKRSETVLRSDPFLDTIPVY